MKCYTAVICLGYENPSREKVEELLKFEKEWLEREYPKNRKIVIHPGICIQETEVYNQSILDELERKDYIEYNLDARDLDTKYNFNSRCVFKISVS